MNAIAMLTYGMMAIGMSDETIPMNEIPDGSQIEFKVEVQVPAFEAHLDEQTILHDGKILKYESEIENPVKGYCILQMTRGMDDGELYVTIPAGMKLKQVGSGTNPQNPQVAFLFFDIGRNPPASLICKRSNEPQPELKPLTIAELKQVFGTNIQLDRKATP